MCGHKYMFEYAVPVCSFFLPVNVQVVRFNSQHLLNELTLKEMHLVYKCKKHNIQQLKQNNKYISNCFANAADSNPYITGKQNCFIVRSIKVI
jgi:hypothetical protein